MRDGGQNSMRENQPVGIGGVNDRARIASKEKPKKQVTAEPVNN